MIKRRTAWVLSASVAAVALGAALVGVLALVLRGRAPALGSGDSYLYLALDREVPEQPPRDIETFFERRPPSLRTLVESLDRAASDDSVRAVVVRLGELPDAGWGKVQELRAALGRFRKSGKAVYAHLETAGNREYYLATACSKVYAVPTAILDISGLAAEVTFFRGTLDKLGIEAQFEGVGKYKNAPNQLTERGFTEPHREQMEALLDSVFGQYLEAIAQGRGKSPQDVAQLVEQGPYTAAEALRAGLVDELLYHDEVVARLKSAERVTPGGYVRGARGLGFDGRARVALVYAVGEIVSGESQDGPFGGSGYAGADTVAGALRQAREDRAVKAIVLRIDSPGGSGTASDVIWREVRLARKAKPVVVSMGDLAASGGYYIAMGGDAIVAQPGTITGSIGVFGGKFSLRGLYDKIGVTRETLTRGRHADLFSDYRPWDEEERAKVRGLMEAFYEEFLRKAAEGRKMSEAEVHAVAQGRVWTGAEAKQHGLVDELGGLNDALAMAKQRAGIARDEDVALVVLPERKGLLDVVLENRDADALGLLPGELRGLLRLGRALQGGAVVARLPFELRIR
jgi:protease-4